METHIPNKEGCESAATYNFSTSPRVTETENLFPNQQNNSTQCKNEREMCIPLAEKKVESMQEKSIGYGIKGLRFFV